MSTESNKATIRRWFEGYNQGNVDRQLALADEVFTPDFCGHGFGPTLDGLKQVVRQILTNAPNNHVTIQDLIAEGDKVVARCQAHGIDPATGKVGDFHLIAIHRFVGVKVAELWQLMGWEPQAQDPVALLRSFDAAVNAGDIERLMAFFSDDAVLKDPVEPKVHTGKQQIRAWVLPQLGLAQVASRNHRVTGQTVTWEATLTGELVRQMGSEAIKETGEAVVQGGKITSFALTIVAPKP